MSAARLGIALDRQADRFCVGLPPAHGDGGVEHHSDRPALEDHVLVGRILFDAGEAENVVDDGAQAIRLIEHDPQEPLGVLAVVQAALQQRFDEAFDRGHRRAELVAGVGHEIAADVFQMPELRHVAEHHQARRSAPRGRCGARCRRRSGSVCPCRRSRCLPATARRSARRCRRTSARRPFATLHGSAGRGPWPDRVGTFGRRPG